MQNSESFLQLSQLAHPSALYFLTPALMPLISPTQEQLREGTSVECEATSELGFEGWAQVNKEDEHFPERGSFMTSLNKY